MYPNDTPSSEIPYGYCHCGCGLKTNLARQTDRARGWIKGEPYKFLNHHASRLMQPNYPYHEEDRGHSTPCWIWDASTNIESGYGAAYSGPMKHRILAHRYMYQKHVGEVPDGLELDHLCKVKNCVNPDHLEAVTHAVNVRRGKNVRFTINQIREIRAMDPATRTTDIAILYNVTTATISKIRLFQSWKEEEP